MKKRRHLQCVTSDEAVDNNGTQHEKPCSDCPWARTALNGWLGPYSLEEWLAIAHFGNVFVDCHTIKHKECAGLAIYQANNAIRPRDRTFLVLEPNQELVFANAAEFRAHHKASPIKPTRKTMASKKATKSTKTEKPLKEPPFNPASTALTEIEEAINEIESDTKNVSRAKYREFLDEVMSMVQMRLETLDEEDRSRG